MEVVSAVASLVSALVDCGNLIYHNTKNFFKLRSNLDVLQQKLRSLRDLQDHVNLELEAEDRVGNLPTPQVKEWLRQVEEIMLVADPMLQPGIPPDNTTVSGCFLNCRLSNKVSKTVREVERLIGVDGYPVQRVASTSHQARMVEYIPTALVEDQPAMSQNLTKILELLNRDEVQRIGIWGMGGVGKTTLVKNLNNKLKSGGSTHLFGMVIWVTVSKDFDRKRVQIQIAERLELAVKESNEDSMAIRLHERLQKEAKFLLILDDVWQAVDLDRLGIPQPEVHTGCRIVLTSRSLRVCVQMKTDEQVKVDVMDGKEAWQLFSATVGGVVDLECVKPVAEEVARQCNGLPLAIVVVGAAMRGKESIQLWDDALSELQRSVPSIEDVEEEVFKPLKWSYDKLQGNNIKSCFLYCCLYPEDFSIEISELVQCWVGEGLIDEQLDYKRSVNRGNALIQNLKDACLLENGERGESVKMHDVVRDVAIWIASFENEGCKSLVRAGIGLTLLSEVEFSGSLKRVSFMNNSLVHCSYKMECSKASTLFLQGNKYLEIVSEEFIQGFPALRVLSVSGSRIPVLPTSIVQLLNLRTLLLRRCTNLKELPASGWETLERIQVLDLSDNNIRVLPRGMQNLRKLRELHLSLTRGLENIPSGVLSMLFSLEVLDMKCSKYMWGMRAEVEDGEAYLEELESLNRLKVLYIGLKCKITLSSTVNLTWISRLTAFVISIGVKLHKYVFGGVSSSRGVYMIGINPSEDERTEYLLSSTDANCLKLFECGGLDQMLQNLALNKTSADFYALKSLYIGSCYLSQARGGSTSGQAYCGQFDLLPNLELLNLSNLNHIESISELFAVLGLRFSKLKFLTVDGCKAMKFLLSFGDDLLLENLQEIRLSHCYELEELFPYATRHAEVKVLCDSVVVAPNLRIIHMYCLPKLRTVCKSSRIEAWPYLEEIVVFDCHQLRKLPLGSQNVANDTIRLIEGIDSWWSQLEWDDPHTKDSLGHLFTPFDKKRLYHHFILCAKI